MSKEDRKIVYKVEGEDPKSIYCTIYQMRNFYSQFADGFFSSLDVMNYIQHHKAVTMMRAGDRILDVCCGRGLLLPMIRYYKKDIAEYVGVDISEKNISEQCRKSGTRNIEGLSFYPFKITHLIESVEDMDKFLEHGSFDFVVYTSAIEHMQKEVGFRSLKNCFNLMKPGADIFLSCPNTMNKKDPYDVQYAAHLYEWDLEELTQALLEVGFEIKNVFGLVAKKREFDEFMETRPLEERRIYNRLAEYLPTPWLISFMPIIYPTAASEVLIIARRPKKGIKGFDFSK
jgi:2-polyprenyl-3-methyl-5-hydroxy-6-metoxy-1,4-benzoquinol methylase